jgi:hypothetical protein
MIQYATASLPLALSPSCPSPCPCLLPCPLALLPTYHSNCPVSVFRAADYRLETIATELWHSSSRLWFSYKVQEYGRTMVQPQTMVQYSSRSRSRSSSSYRAAVQLRYSTSHSRPGSLAYVLSILPGGGCVLFPRTYFSLRSPLPLCPFARPNAPHRISTSTYLSGSDIWARKALSLWLLALFVDRGAPQKKGGR